jgi:hypothetical protein
MLFLVYLGSEKSALKALTLGSKDLVKQLSMPKEKKPFEPKKLNFPNLRKSTAQKISRL